MKDGEVSQGDHPSEDIPGPFLEEIPGALLKAEFE